MPRKRRLRVGWRRPFDHLELIVGPDWIVAPTDAAMADRIEEMGSWYELHGAEWEAARTARHPGCRSWAFWEFVAGEQVPPLDDQAARLLELGVLTDNERAALNTNQRSATNE